VPDIQAGTPYNMSQTLTHRLFALAKALLFDPKYFGHLAGLVILGDVVLTQLIIRFVPCLFCSIQQTAFDGS
jgi:hypothetical protein